MITKYTVWHARDLGESSPCAGEHKYIDAEDILDWAHSWDVMVVTRDVFEQKPAGSRGKGRVCGQELIVRLDVKGRNFAQR